MEYVKDDNNVGMFSFGYSSTDMSVNEEDMLYPLPSFVAEVGGALGLFLGFSFFSLWEVFIDLSKYIESCVNVKRKNSN